MLFLTLKGWLRRTGKERELEQLKALETAKGRKQSRRHPRQAAAKAKH